MRTSPSSASRWRSRITSASRGSAPRWAATETASSGRAGGPGRRPLADAVDQDAAEQQERHDGDGVGAQQAGPLQGVLDAGPGHGHERGLDATQAPAVLQQAGELHEVGAGVGVGGAPTDEHDCGSVRVWVVGVGQPFEGGAGSVLGDVEHRRVEADVAGQPEADPRVAGPRPGQDGGSVVLEVAGAEEDVRDRDHVGGTVGDQAVDGGVDRRLGQLQESGAHPHVGRSGRTCAHELVELLGRRRAAAAVADEEQVGPGHSANRITKAAAAGTSAASH